jgi:hypothetical protein
MKGKRKQMTSLDQSREEEDATIRFRNALRSETMADRYRQDISLSFGSAACADALILCRRGRGSPQSEEGVETAPVLR